MVLLNWKIQETHDEGLECDGTWVDLHNVYSLESLVYRVEARDPDGTLHSGEVNVTWRKVYHGSEAREQPEGVTLSFCEVDEVVIWPAVVETGYERDTVERVLVTSARAAGTLSHPFERRVSAQGVAGDGMAFAMEAQSRWSLENHDASCVGHKRD